MLIRGVDCETFKITPTNPCPTVVCLASAKPEGSVTLLEKSRAKDYLRRLLDSEAKLVGANIPYDVVSCMKTWPEMIPAWFQAMEDERLSDIRIREALELLATTGNPDGGKGGVHSLAQLARKYVGINMEVEKDGPDSWRTRFGELAGIKSDDYPKAAAAYVKQDADATLQVYLHQKSRKPEALHVNAAVCYFLRTVRGLTVDVKAKEKLQAECQAAVHPDKLKRLYKSGIRVRGTPERPGLTKAHTPECRRPSAAKGGCQCPRKVLKAVPDKGSKLKLVAQIVRVCEEHGLRVLRNPPTDAEKRKAEEEGREPVGSIKTDKNILKKLAPFCKTLAQQQTFNKYNKLLTSYFPSMEWPFGSGVTATRVFCGYDYVKKTGRGSGRGNSKKNLKKHLYPSMAIQLADPRVRGCLPPREGFVYAVADYSAIDLNCLAQTIKDLYGSSTLLDQINGGIDPHGFLATVLAYDGDKRFHRHLDGITDDRAAYDMFMASKKTAPKFFTKWRKLAKTVGLGYPGGMGLETMVSVCMAAGFKITKDQAKHYKKLWLRIYPEMRWYLQKWVTAQKDYTGEWLAYTSPLGMRRVKCSFPECANGRALQTPAAEGKKIADFLLTRACYDVTREDVLYGCYPVIDMHDEFVVEVPISDPDTMDAQARRLGELMVLGMKKVLPDVNVKAEPYLTTLWVKNAGPVFDKKGRLIPWVSSET